MDVVWSGPSGFSGNQSNILISSASLVNTGMYRASITTSCGIISDSFFVNVNPLPNVDLGADFSICKATIHKLSLTSNPTYSYLWNNSSTASQIEIDKAGLYWVNVTTDEGCTSSDSVNISIFPETQIDILADQLTFNCQTGSKVTLEATNGLNSYQWFPIEYFENSNNRITEIFPPKSMYLYVEGRDYNGCYTRDSIWIDVNGNSGLQIPNAFTPNGDGVNDVFSIKNSCNFELHKFVIYNRWGQYLFFTHLLGNGWDGTFQGKPVDAGVYFYYIEGVNISDKTFKTYKGDITLLR